MSDSGNYCRDKCKEFEDVPPSYSGDTEVKYVRCTECGSIEPKRWHK